jgi:hypothetical protein
MLLGNDLERPDDDDLGRSGHGPAISSLAPRTALPTCDTDVDEL